MGDISPLASDVPKAYIPPMTILKAHFDGKVLIPDEPVNLPMDCVLKVQVEPMEKSPDDDAQRERVYAILSERYESGERDVAARHNEHQP